MDPDIFANLFNPMTPGWGYGGSMAASIPQITPTMMYPFSNQLGPETAPWLTPPNFATGQEADAMGGGATTSRTDAEGRPLDATGQPIPSVSGGAIPTSPSPLAYSQNQAAGTNTANPGGGSADRLLATLRGVQAPAPPTPQRVASPHAPAQRPIQSGQLINLLTSLGIRPGDLFRIPGFQGR